MKDPFALGMDFGSDENCVSRLEILLPPLVLMMDAKQKIHERLMVPIYEDSCIFYDENDQLDFSNIKDESVRERALNILPDLKRLLACTG